MSEILWRPLPAWSERIRSHYWELRWARGRDSARVRKMYRRIRAERDSLERQGVNREALRLLCRFLSDPLCEVALVRFWCCVDSLAVLRGAAYSGSRVSRARATTPETGDVSYGLSQAESGRMGAGRHDPQGVERL